MSKQLTAEELFKFLQSLNDDGVDLSKVTINYRYDDDSDVEVVTCVDEDLFDSETNNVLESIIFQTRSVSEDTTQN